MNKTALFLLFTVLTLFSIGVLMVYNTTSAEVLGAGDQSLHIALVKHLIDAFLALCLGAIIYHIDTDKIYTWSPLFFWGGCTLLALVLIPGVGRQINGARRWMEIAGFSFQPSEFMKLLIPLYYLKLFVSLDKPFLLKNFLKFLFVLSIPIMLTILEPDNGTAAIMLTMLIALFYLTKVRWVYWGLPILSVACVGIAFASKMHHVVDRIRIYLNPELDLLGKGHQPYQAKIAAGAGKLFGRGLGQSLQKLSYLPEARSDYIAAIYAEEFGFLGVLLLLMLYMLVAYFGFRIASKAKTREGFYLSSILTFLIVFQAFLNLGVVSGLLPSKGTNLPFFSKGGSSLIANVMCLSLILNVAKAPKAERDFRFRYKKARVQ